MPVTVSASQRARLLEFAACIPPDPSDAAAVAEAAFCLMDWAEKASGEDDLAARIEALRAQWINARPRSGNAQAFIGQAEILYAFATAATGSQVP